MEVKKSKNYILLICVLIIVTGCRSNISGQRKNNLYQNIIRAFIENRNSKIKIDPQTNILLIGANTNENFKDAYWLDMSFVNPKLLHDFKYTKVYEIEGYRLIIDELLNKSSELKSSFKETKYENLNLATEIIDYDSKHWLITFNSKNEIIRISPQQKSKEIKELLLKKGVKFSKDFEE